MTDKYEQAEQKTLKFWLSAQKSEGKKNIQPKGFIIRLPNGSQDLSYAEQGEWVSNLREAKSFEHLKEADTLCDQLQADPSAIPLDDINPMMADLGIMPQLQVVYWGLSSERTSYIRVL
ncbi:hypothetical protein [Nissabacter archeti]|uniref:hypothetical protein n=1 Tax=Nissabacter archeti TaxID=1917880 RepID=UPI000934CC58|nr:hypothetical protein [Nissabacter archeti]